MSLSALYSSVPPFQKFNSLNAKSIYMYTSFSHDHNYMCCAVIKITLNTIPHVYTCKLVHVDAKVINTFQPMWGCKLALYVHSYLARIVVNEV